MAIPSDPGTGLQDNTKTPILLAGATGLHKRFKNLYDMFSGAIGLDNINASLTSLLIGSRRPGDMFNVGFFYGGTGNGTITIKQANGNSFANTDGNRGYIWLRSATNGSIIRGKITSNVTLSPVGAHWGAGTKGDLASAILRVYAINDGNTADDFTPKWGLGYQGGFQYIRNTQGSATATDINLPEEIFVNSAITNDNSPMSDMGYSVADFDDTGNVNGEDFWTFTSTHPGESADGIWQPFNPAESGFSSLGGGTHHKAWTMVGKVVHVHYFTPASSTSNSTNFRIFMPIKAATLQGVTHTVPVHYITDNSVTSTTIGSADFNDGSTQVNIFKDIAGTSFTAANFKRAAIHTFYSAYQP